MRKSLWLVVLLTPLCAAALEVAYAQKAAMPDEIITPFTKCLATEGRDPSLTPKDGGLSAMQLLVKCRSAMDRYNEVCIALGSTAGSCRLEMIMAAQSALLLIASGAR
jgi:hypothetical protein